MYFAHFKFSAHTVFHASRTLCELETSSKLKLLVSNHCLARLFLCMQRTKPMLPLNCNDRAVFSYHQFSYCIFSCPITKHRQQMNPFVQSIECTISALLQRKQNQLLSIVIHLNSSLSSRIYNSLLMEGGKMGDNCITQVPNSMTPFSHKLSCGYHEEIM